MDKVFDYIVIGSGFGGSVASLRLAEKGYSVLVLEKGKRFHPHNFPKTNWNLRKYLWLPALRFFGIQKLSFYKDASILTGVGVGGGSLVYANTLFHPPDEFFNHASWKHFADWKKVLHPFYENAAFMMGRAKYGKQNIEDELLYRVAEKMGCQNTYDTVRVGVYLSDEEKEVDPYFNDKGPLRHPCTECAGCMVGCRENAKNSLDKNYLFFAEYYGAEIRAETRVIKINCEHGLYGIETKSTTSFPGSKKKTFRSRGLIISGGTLGSLELLLKQKYKYKTLPGLSEKLGHSLITNSETLCAVSGIPEKTNNGLAITSVINPDDNTHIEVVKYPDGSNALRAFFTLSAPRAKTLAGRILKLILNIIRHPVRFIKVTFRPGWSSRLVIFLVMQHIENAMIMVWKNGLLGGRMKIDNRGQKRVPAYIDVGQQTMENYARESGGIAQNIVPEILFNRPTTAHILGGCPMSHNISQGVVGPDLKVHGYPNMYIVDGSVIQGNIGVNPSFTILAMAEYAMDKIPEQARNDKTDLATFLSVIPRQNVAIH